MGGTHHVVRLFPDHADSPIWFCVGEVGYEEARLTPGLRARLEAWEHLYYEGLEASEGLGAVFDAEGGALATELAAQLGEGFRVDRLTVHDEWVSHASTTAATNENARDAFLRRSRDLATLRSRIEDEQADGAEFGWFAGPPPSSHSAPD